MNDPGTDGQQPPKPTPAASDPPPRSESFAHARVQCDTMIAYANGAGLSIPDTVFTWLHEADTQAEPAADTSLNQAHNALAGLVAPATPGALTYLAKQKSERFFFWQFLGPVPTIRFMSITSIASLLTFILLGSSEHIPEDRLDTKLLYHNDFSEALLISLFLLSAAAIGVSFSNLYKARQFIIAGTYDPKYNTTYWMRFVLGLTSGFILAELVPLHANAGLQKPVLALVGGFAADVVYNILERIVEGVRSMVRGDIKTRLASMESKHKSDLQSQGVSQGLAAAQVVMEKRAVLQQKGATPEQLKEIDDLIATLIQGSGGGAG